MNRKSSCWPVIVLGVALTAAACDDEPLEPVEVADVSGFWSGQYEVTGCVPSDAVDPFFCGDVFASGASLILELDLFQSGSRVEGEIVQGALFGDVEGAVDLDGVLRLEGVIGGGGDDFTTTILAWQTGVVGDSLLGSWRFWIEDNLDEGFGAAVVDAGVRLYGPSVVKFFGCAAESTLDPDGERFGLLDDSDCQLATGQFVEGVEDGAFMDVFALSGSAGDSLDVTLRSTDIDALLLVADLDEQVLGGDDDSGGGPNGTDAAVTIVFDTDDTVLLLATSFAPGERGGYTLGAQRLAPSTARALAPSRPGELAGGIRVLGGGWKRGRDPQRDGRRPGWLLRRSSSRAIRSIN